MLTLKLHEIFFLKLILYIVFVILDKTMFCPTSLSFYKSQPNFEANFKKSAFF